MIKKRVHMSASYSVQIEFPSPNEAARHDILKIHSRKMNLTRKINLKKIADQMTGASKVFADLPRHKRIKL
jgi:ATP-dependent 26S proteasome regulatory subunit